MVSTRLTMIIGLVILASSASGASQSPPAPVSGSFADFQQSSQDHETGQTPAVDCYKAMCWCTNDTADCSRNFGNLTFIPKFSENITILKFSHNKLKKIPDEDFFSNVTGLLFLDLGVNELRNLSQNSFRKLEKLRCLWMNENPLHLAEALPVFEISSLQELEFKFGRAGVFPDNFFASHVLPELQRLDLTDSVRFRNEELDMALFSPLPRLQKLTLSSNYIKLVNSGKNFTSLIYLDLSLNNIERFPPTCENQTSLYPNLQELNLNYNHIKNLSTVCLPSLRILKLNSNRVGQFVSDMFSPHSFPSLEAVYVEKMKTRVKSILDFAFRNSGLRSLSLANNKLPFAETNISENMFSGCSALVNLSLSFNNFSGISEARMMSLFQPLLSLQSLDLSTDLQNLPKNVLGLMPKLTKLVVWGNLIAEIPNGTFSSLRNLTVLDLSDNQLTSVNETAFGTETRNQLQQLDLSGNPFHCSCSDDWFPRWLETNPALFAHPRFDYVCVNYNYTNITSFFDDECTSTTASTQTTPSARSTTARHRNVKPSLFAILYVFIAVVVLVIIVSVTYLLYTRRCRGYFWNWTGARRQYHPILP